MERRHIHRKTKTYRHRDIQRHLYTKDTLRDNHRRTVKGGLSLESEPQTLIEVCRGKRKKYFEKERHEKSQRQGEKQREKHRCAQAEGESCQREIQFERQTKRGPAKGRNSGRMDGWMGGWDG